MNFLQAATTCNIILKTRRYSLAPPPPAPRCSLSPLRLLFPCAISTAPSGYLRRKTAPAPATRRILLDSVAKIALHRSPFCRPAPASSSCKCPIGPPPKPSHRATTRAPFSGALESSFSLHSPSFASAHCCVSTAHFSSLQQRNILHSYKRSLEKPKRPLQVIKSSDFYCKTVLITM
jgi:hypothetical protein